MGSRQPWYFPVSGKQRVVIGINSRRLGGQQRQRQQTERAVSRDDQIFRRSPVRFSRLQQRCVEIVGKVQIEGRNIGNHRGIRFERLAKLRYLGVNVAELHVYTRKLDWPVLPQHPHETVEPTKVERKQGLVRRKLLLQIGGTGGRRIHQVSVPGKLPRDVFQALRARRLQAR